MDDMNELRARVRAQYGDGTDLPRTADERVSRKSGKKRTGPAESLRQQKRQRTGGTFQADIDDTHEGMAARGEGAVYRHHVPTKRVSAQKIVITGGALCDYSGHVNIASRGQGALRVPVVFDAKVLGEEHANYKHDRAQLHQLLQLRVAHQNGALAFLMVRADRIGRVFLIPFGTYGERLIRGEGVQLFTRLSPSKDEWSPLVPDVGYTPGKGWLYRSAVVALMTPETRT